MKDKLSATWILEQLDDIMFKHNIIPRNHEEALIQLENKITNLVLEIREGGNMEVCNRGHEEIVFDGLVCPFCEILDENDRLIDEIAELKEKIADLEKE